uniref:Homeobox domain-containing protein n=1 Tax=Oryza punctata TaxID=4537 RepID=A0A0E0LBP5_ORYPU
MGRPPSTGGPAFRFTQAEVAEMEARLQQLNNAIPHRSVIQALADKFTSSPARSGKLAVQPKQVWNWFQNRRYSHRSRSSRGPPPLMQTKMLPTGSDEHKSSPFRAMPSASAHSGSPSGKGSLESGQVEFEAKSARDGAWYDVAAFLSHRLFESGDPEVRVRFSGFGAEEDEWINVRKCVRQRSLPCESTECVAVLPGDLILCFQAKSRLCISMLVSLMLKGVDMMYEGVAVDFLFAMIMITLSKKNMPVAEAAARSSSLKVAGEGPKLRPSRKQGLLPHVVTFLKSSGRPTGARLRASDDGIEHGGASEFVVGEL